MVLSGGRYPQYFEVNVNFLPLKPTQNPILAPQSSQSPKYILVYAHITRPLCNHDIGVQLWKFGNALIAKKLGGARMVKSKDSTMAVKNWGRARARRANTTGRLWFT